MKKPISKPRVLLDIKSKSLNSFSHVTKKINTRDSVFLIPVKKVAQGILLSSVLLYLGFGSVFAPHNPAAFAVASSDAERAVLEAELERLNKEIEDNQGIASAYQRQGDSLESEINGLESKINSLNKQIRAITLSLGQLDGDIDDNIKQISSTEEKIKLNRRAISRAIQGVYENEQVSLVAVLLKNGNLTDFFSDVNNLLDIQDSLTTIVQQNNLLKDDLLDQKDDLVLKKDDTIALKDYQDRQKKQVAAAKVEKDELLEVTRGSEEKYQQIVQQKKKSAAEIRSRIFRLLGGGEMTFEEAYRLAKFAEDATGVDAAFLLAIMQQESSLGGNVGRCTYHKSMPAGPPESRRNDVKHFLRITADLGLDPETTLVSCPIASVGGWGGAMGAGQFIPSTWILFEDKVAEITGNNPPSPWRNGDAFVATSLLIKDNLRSCRQYDGNKQVRCAASRYYGGGYWKKYEWSYGVGIQNKRDQFAADIEAVFES